MARRYIAKHPGLMINPRSDMANIPTPGEAAVTQRALEKYFAHKAKKAYKHKGLVISPQDPPLTGHPGKVMNAMAPPEGGGYVLGKGMVRDLRYMDDESVGKGYVLGGKLDRKLKKYLKRKAKKHAKKGKKGHKGKKGGFVAPLIIGAVTSLAKPIVKAVIKRIKTNVALHKEAKARLMSGEGVTSPKTDFGIWKEAFRTAKRSLREIIGSDEKGQKKATKIIKHLKRVIIGDIRKAKSGRPIMGGEATVGDIARPMILNALARSRFPDTDGNRYQIRKITSQLNREPEFSRPYSALFEKKGGSLKSVFRKIKKMASRVMNSKFGKTVRETVVPELGRMASEALQNYVGDKGAIGKMVGDIGQIGIDEAQDWAMPKKEPPMKEQTPLDRAKEIAHNIAAEEIPIPRESIMTPKMKEMEALLASLEADPKAVGSGVLADLRAYVASQRGKK